MTAAPDDPTPVRFREETIHIDNLHVECIIGIHPEERIHPQSVIVSAAVPRDFSAAAAGDTIAETLDYSAVAEAIRAFVAESRFQLLETLIRRLAEHVAERFDLPRLSLHIRKPAALPGSEGPAVSLTLTRGEGTGP